jgi:uncharacterized LabA/DUF88 family protein
MELAAHIDEIPFSGDGDFRTLVEAVQRRGVRVTVVSSIASQPPMIADELRPLRISSPTSRSCAKVGRDLSERPPLRERGEMRTPQFVQRAPATRPRGDVDEFNG